MDYAQGSHRLAISMDMNTLSTVEFGNVDALRAFLFENNTQHQVFAQELSLRGVSTPMLPILDANPDNLDDWLQLHNQIHERVASALGLDNPFNLVDSDWQVEGDFYDWIGVHTTIHQQILAALGVT